MTLAEARSLINNTYGANGAGTISGPQLRDSLLEVLNRIEAQASWQPVFSLINNGANTAMKIVNWSGGQGVKPPVNVFLGSGGAYVSDINAAINLRGPGGGAISIANCRTQTTPVGSALDSLTISDKGKSGFFLLDPTDTTTPDDGVLCLVTANNLRYKRQLPENRITPQLFGAKGDGITDDGAALLAWINCSGNYEHYIPAGVYVSGVALIRTNKKGITLRGPGASQTTIQFPNDTHGVQVANLLNQNAYGPIGIYGIELQSTGAKSADKVGLFINSEHEQYPGPQTHDLVVRSVGNATNQWGIGWQYHNTSHSNNTGWAIYGCTQTRGIGMVISTDEQRSSVEHNFSHWTIFNVQRAALFDSPLTSPQGHGNEGIQFNNGSAYALLEGFRGVVTNRAPLIGFSNVHVATQGGYAIYLDGYTDVTFHGVELQVYTAPDGTIPPYALHLGNITFATGDIRVFLRGNLPIGTELKGVSGGINLKIAGSYNSAQTYFVKQDSDCNAVIDAGGIWTNDPATFADWGSVPHPPLTVVGGGAGRQPVISSEKQAVEGNVLRFTENSKYIYEPVKPHVTDIASYTVVGGGVQTVSMADYDLILVTGSASTTIIVDRSTAPVGKKITIARFDEGATGQVVIRSDAPTFNLFQDFDLVARQSVLLPFGLSPQTWTYIGVFKLIGGGNSLNPLNNLSDVASVATVRANLGLGSAATQPASAFVAATGGFITPAYTTTITATSGWVSSTYNELVPEGTMVAGHTYLLQVRLVKPGSDQSNYAFIIPAELGWTGFGVHPDLTPVANYYASSTRSFKVRFKTTSGGGVTGLEGTLTSTDMQGASVEVKLIPLL